MSLITNIKRRLLAPAIYSSRIPFRAWKSGNKNVIFNYHGVIGGDYQRINNRHMSSLQFEADLKFFQKHFNVVSLSEIFSNPEPMGSSAVPKVAITFDDGFENNFEFALPILLKYNMPATIFVLSASIDNSEFVNWADLLDVLASVSQDDFIDFMDVKFVKRGSGFISEGNPDLTLSEFIKNQGSERLEPLEKLAKSIIDDRQVLSRFRWHFKLMNVSQIQECARTGLIEIASHTRNHFNLGRVSEGLAKSELETSRRDLESILQKEVHSLAYPDGDYNESVKSIAEKVGYRRQLAVSFVSENDAVDPRIRRRFSYSNSTNHASNMIRLGFQWNNFSF